MTTVSRRQLLTGVATASLLGGCTAAEAVDPVKRTGKPRIKASIAAYSYRQRLTGRAEPRMTLQDFVRLAAEMGWDGVELTSYYFPDPVPEGYFAELKRLCFLLGLQVSATSMATVFTHPAGPARDAEIRRTQTLLRYAAELGAPVLRVFAGAPQPGQSADEAARCCVECLETCAETASRVGVMLALENHGGIVADAAGVLKIIKAVRSPWCGVNLDTGNFRTADPYRDIELCAPFAITTHLKTEVQPAGGSVLAADIPRIVRILASAGYRGFLTLEHEAAEPVDEAAPRVLRLIREATTSLQVT